MTDRQAKLLLSSARLVTARLEELLMIRRVWQGPPGSDPSDWYGVAQVQKALRNLAKCAATKEMSLAERVALARAYRERAGERRGRPRKGEAKKKRIFAGFPAYPLCPGESVEAVAARVAGFNGKDALRAARLVVERGGPELAAKVDSGDKSLWEAAREARQKAGAVPG